MKISIIIPVYNVSAYIVDCLDSVALQKYHDMECIIVDDCGTDDSVEKIETWLDGYDGPIEFKFIRNESNKGLSLSRNAGLAIATGDYVLFLDSDDYLLDDSINKVFSSIGEATPDIVRTNYIRFIESSGDKVYNATSKSAKEFNGAGKDFLLREHDASFNYVWLNFFKRSFLVENNLQFIPMYYEDMPFTFESFYLAKHVVHVQEPMVVYRIRKGSITNSNVEMKISSNLIVIYETYLSIVKKHNIPKEYLPLTKEHFLFLSSEMWNYSHSKEFDPEKIRKVLHSIQQPLHKYYAFLGVKQFVQSILWTEPWGYWLIKVQRLFTKKYEGL